MCTKGNDTIFVLRRLIVQKEREIDTHMIYFAGFNRMGKSGQFYFMEEESVASRKGLIGLKAEP